MKAWLWEAIRTEIMIEQQKETVKALRIFHICYFCKCPVYSRRGSEATDITIKNKQFGNRK